jgi:hypothetical protein
MPPESWSGRASARGQPHRLQRPVRPFPLLGRTGTADLERVGGVLPHCAVREQREVLEDHADLLVAHGAQLRVVERPQVPAVDLDGTRAGLDEPVEQPDQRGLARARQAHDDEQLSALDGEADVVDRERGPGAPENLVAPEALAGQPQGVLLARAEDLRQARDAQHRRRHVSRSTGRSGRRGHRPTPARRS